MNWGIVSLLAVVGLIWAGFGAFFVFLAKRSAATRRKAGSPALMAAQSPREG
jgi:maltodextrin utilization protein YvdJ